MAIRKYNIILHYIKIKDTKTIKCYQTISIMIIKKNKKYEL